MQIIAHRVEKANSVLKMVLAKTVAWERSRPTPLAARAHPAPLVPSKLWLAEKRAIQSRRDSMQQEKGIQNKLDAAKTSGLELAHRPFFLLRSWYRSIEWADEVQRHRRMFGRSWLSWTFPMCQQSEN